MILALCSLTCIEAYLHGEDFDLFNGKDIAETHSILVKPIFQKTVTVGSDHITGSVSDQKDDVLPLTSAKSGKRKRVGKIIGIL